MLSVEAEFGIKIPEREITALRDHAAIATALGRGCQVVTVREALRLIGADAPVA